MGRQGGPRPKLRGRRRWPAAAVALLAVVPLAVGCSSSNPGTSARQEVRTFLAAAARNDVEGACATFTRSYRSRLAPADDTCLTAISTLSRYTTQGGNNLLDDKVIKSSTLDGDVAVVTVADRETGDNELAIRVRQQADGSWRIDEIGAGAQLTEACATERKELAAAVERYFEDHDTYPTDPAQMVPGLLRKAPDNHKLGKDGAIIGTGVCA